MAAAPRPDVTSLIAIGGKAKTTRSDVRECIEKWFQLVGSIPRTLHNPKILLDAIVALLPQRVFYPSRQYNLLESRTKYRNKLKSMEEDDVAAAMGFSSFGSTKKRKFDQTNSPKAKPTANGANATRLGVRPKVVVDNSIEEGELEGVKDATLVAELTQTPASASQTSGKQKPHAPAGLADFLSRGQSLPEKPVGTQGTDFAPVQGDASSEMVSFGGPLISSQDLNALRFGVKDENGDTAYFLPSFVEDPWEKFMKVDEAGLIPN